MTHQERLEKAKKFKGIDKNMQESFGQAIADIGKATTIAQIKVELIKMLTSMKG